MIGAYQPVAALITWARHLGMALARELGAAGAGVYVTQVVPFPQDDSLPVVRAYLRALAAYDAEAVPGFVSFEGYLAGRLAVAGIAGCGPALDRTCFLDSLRRSDVIDLDGFELRYGTADKQGSDAVFLTRAEYPYESFGRVTPRAQQPCRRRESVRLGTAPIHVLASIHVVATEKQRDYQPEHQQRHRHMARPWALGSGIQVISHYRVLRGE